MFEELQNFFFGYLHQGYDIEFPEPLEAARQFAAESDLGPLFTVVGQIAVLTADEDEGKLEAFAKNAKLDFWPPDGHSLP